MLGRRTRWIAGLTIAAIAGGLAGGGPAQAVAGGGPAPDGAYRFVAKVEYGATRSCTGALVSPIWIVTSASCFADPGSPAAVGAPRQSSRAIVGRTDLDGESGHSVSIVELVPHSSRNLVLAKLGTRISDIQPVPLATAAPVAGEALRAAGYGRTHGEWVPGKPHTATFTAETVTSDAVSLIGAPGASICKGDSGGPTFREAGGRAELVAVHSSSWQRGCLGETGDRDGATEVRIDNLTDWIYRNTPDPATTAATKQTLSWLSRLPDRGENRITSGQFAGYSSAGFSTAETAGALRAATGQDPGILSCDYASKWANNGDADTTGNYPAAIDSACNADLKKWAHDGGLVSISVHAPHLTDPKAFRVKLPEFAQRTDPETQAGAAWRQQLDQIAAGLRDLADSGVPVLFRPFHEMNGDWFWWSAQDPAAFAETWRKAHRYLTVTKGLNNLIWVYAPDCRGGNQAAYYPGAQYADVVGLDCYVNNPADAAPGYRELISLGKPFAFTEIGAADGSKGQFDFSAWVRAFHDQYPATVYFLGWNDEWSMTSNRNGQSLMNDPWVTNRGEITLADQVAPVGLAGFESTTDGWTGYKVAAGPWVVDEWTAEGSKSLKADVNLASGESMLQQVTKRDLAGKVTLTAVARTAPWGDHAGGTEAKLYVRTGAGLQWFDSAPVTVGPSGTRLALDLAAVPNLNDVREIGVSFTPAADASGGSAIYVDAVTVSGPGTVLAGFESGTTAGWTGYKAAAGPWVVDEWTAEGSKSLKADVNLASGESMLQQVTKRDLAGKVTLTAVARTAPWGDHAGGTEAKLYVRTGAGLQWFDSAPVTVGPSGTRLALDLTKVAHRDDVREIGVSFTPAKGASGGSAIYVDNVRLR